LFPQNYPERIKGRGIEQTITIDSKHNLERPFYQDFDRD